MLIISEFSHISSQGPVISPPIAEHAVDGSAGSAVGPALNPATRVVRLCATVNSHVAFGSNPVADATKFPVGAFAPEYLSVTSSDRIAVIDA